MARRGARRGAGRRGLGPLWRLLAIGGVLAGFWWAARMDDRAGAAQVHDGDTITVAGQRIRLYGIDAPELSQDCRDRDGATYACGRLAKLRLERLTRGEVRCDAVETDRYRREVSICRAGDVDLGAAMVSSGWARAYLRYSLRYADSEREARDARRGLWAGAFEDPWAWRDNGYKDDLIAAGWRWAMEKLF